jgi:hypothetical protein
MGQLTLPVPAGLTYKREIFKASSTFTLPLTAQNKFDAILISGGGGGSRTTSTSAQYVANGGNGGFLYVSEVYCTNGTTLTITIGAGGVGGLRSGATSATAGTVSTISGIAGNGASTSISSPIARPGVGANQSPTSIGGSAYTSDVTSIKNIYNGGRSDRGGTRGIGIGNISIATGSESYGGSRTIFQMKGMRYVQGSGGSNTNTDSAGHAGGPIPLLGSYLHATAGGTGTNGNMTNGAVSTANTFISGSGGGANGYLNPGVGSGGGGGGGGGANGGNIAGNGGAGSVNSGGGGGGAGRNLTGANNGDGGSGGSGLIIIGYWG